MNNILHLVTVYEVLIYCQTIQAVGGYRKEEEIGNMRLCIPHYLTTESGRINVMKKNRYTPSLVQLDLAVRNLCWKTMPITGEKKVYSPGNLIFGMHLVFIVYCASAV